MAGFLNILTDLSKKTLRLYEKGRPVLLTETVKGVLERDSDGNCDVN